VSGEQHFSEVLVRQAVCYVRRAGAPGGAESGAVILFRDCYARFADMSHAMRQSFEMRMRRIFYVTLSLFARDVTAPGHHYILVTYRRPRRAQDSAHFMRCYLFGIRFMIMLHHVEAQRRACYV